MDSALRKSCTRTAVTTTPAKTAANAKPTAPAPACWRDVEHAAAIRPTITAMPHAASTNTANNGRYMRRSPATSLMIGITLEVGANSR